MDANTMPQQINIQPVEVAHVCCGSILLPSGRIQRLSGSASGQVSHVTGNLRHVCAAAAAAAFAILMLSQLS